jgi:hypothetical protein
MTDHIHCIRQVVEAPTPRWMFEGGMREAAREALAVLWHEANERMAHLQYRHFLSQAEEGAEAVVLPAGDHDRIGCFTDQVKLTRALVQDLDEAIKEVKLLEEHEEESSQKIMELETMCKKLREDARKLRKEKATLEGMANTRNWNNKNAGDNNGENKQNVNPPPPPLRTLEHVLAMQAQMVQTMQQTMVNMQAACNTRFLQE